MRFESVKILSHERVEGSDRRVWWKQKWGVIEGFEIIVFTESVGTSMRAGGGGSARAPRRTPKQKLSSAHHTEKILEVSARTLDLRSTGGRLIFNVARPAKRLIITHSSSAAASTVETQGGQTLEMGNHTTIRFPSSNSRGYKTHTHTRHTNFRRSFFFF